jgi:hypothetical protein
MLEGDSLDFCEDCYLDTKDIELERLQAELKMAGYNYDGAMIDLEHFESGYNKLREAAQAVVGSRKAYKEAFVNDGDWTTLCVIHEESIDNLAAELKGDKHE